ADLGGMAEATTLVTHVSALVWVPAYACAIVIALVWASYRAIARVFKWLTLVLGAYVLTAFFTTIDWPAALRMTVLPSVTWTRDYFSVLVAIFGTTISPYLFFWQ